MGNYSNKIPNPFSATSGSGDGDDPSRITQVLTIFAVIGLITSVFAGSAAAASATGVTANDPTYDGSSWTQYTDIEGISASSGEQITLTFNDSADSNIDFSNMSSQIAMTSWAEVNSTSVSGDQYVVTVDITSSVNGSTLTVATSGHQFNGPGTATVSTGGAVSSYSDTFSYSEPQGTVSVGNITTSDGASVSPDVSIVDSNGNTVVSALNISESYSTQLAEGNYTVEATADGYENISKSISVNYNSTTTVDLDFTASTTETSTATETETNTSVDYEVTVEDNGSALDSFDISLKDNDSDVASASVSSNDSNTVTFQNLSEGDYTVEVNYTDSDGNQTTYTESVSVDAADAENGTVSQTVDVDESDDGFFGGVPSFDNPFSGLTDVFNNFTDSLPSDPADLALTVLGGFVGVVGFSFILIWTWIGIRSNRRI